MKNKILRFALLLFAGVGWSCTASRPATIIGPEGYTCFTNLNATRAEITRALWIYYDKFPENRIDYKYMQETGIMNQESMNHAKGNPARTDSLERGYFYSWHLKPDNSRGERWQLSTSDRKIGYGLTMEYCDTTGRQNCNLCLVGQIKKSFWTSTGQKDLYLSKREQRRFVAYLEQDLINRLKVIIETDRQKR